MVAADYLAEYEIEFLALLLEHRVDFMVVGGAAVQIHGFSRPRKDFDVLVRPSEDNAKRLEKALEAGGIELGAENTKRLAMPRAQMPVGMPFPYTEIITSLGDMDYGELERRALVFENPPRKIPVISRLDLIAAKRLRGEPSDMVDIAALEAP